VGVSIKEWLRKRKWYNVVAELKLGLFLGSLFLASGLLGLIELDIPVLAYPAWSLPIVPLHDRMGTELVGIGLTVLVIDFAAGLRKICLEKRHHIRLMRSHNHDTARDAARHVRGEHWMFDGTLRKAELTRANLYNANLEKADMRFAGLSYANLGRAYLKDAGLRGVDLTKASLERAKMGGIKLQGANLTNANLRGATGLGTADLEGATLPDGTEWMEGAELGRFTQSKHPYFEEYPSRWDEFNKKMFKEKAQ
jgi:hypothetical protein